MQAPAITTALAGIRRSEQIDAARAHRVASGSGAPGAAVTAEAANEIAIRFARSDEAPALARLAALDGRGVNLEGDVLVAVVAGGVVAARGLRGGAISDPFRAGGEILALLDVRARQLAGGGVRTVRPRPPRRTMPVLRVGGAR